jgi:hypothetical protein
MARKIRIEYAGGAYHVMARGNQGRDIYADDRGDGRRITGDAGHWPAEAEMAAGIGATEKATGAGL